jgi:hypothetical protein
MPISPTEWTEAPTKRALKPAQPVPGFFQADDDAAQVAQVEWLEHKLKLDDRFFANVLDVAPSALDLWRQRKTALNKTGQRRQVELWSMFLHLFSFLDHDYAQVHALLETRCRSSEDVTSRLLPPWAGHSIRDHLEKSSPQAIEDVDRWVTSFRFSDRYETRSLGE